MQTEPVLTPLLVDSAEAARLIGVKKSLFYALNSQGRIPAPVKLSSKSLWNYELLRLWTINGCPSRDSTEWQQIIKEAR